LNASVKEFGRHRLVCSIIGPSGQTLEAERPLWVLPKSGEAIDQRPSTPLT
jgi:hypothetical protein